MRVNAGLRIGVNERCPSLTMPMPTQCFRASKRSAANGVSPTCWRTSAFGRTEFEADVGGHRAGVKTRPLKWFYFLELEGFDLGSSANHEGVRDQLERRAIDLGFARGQEGGEYPVNISIFFARPEKRPLPLNLQT